MAPPAHVPFHPCLTVGASVGCRYCVVKLLGRGDLRLVRAETAAVRAERERRDRRATVLAGAGR